MILVDSSVWILSFRDVERLSTVRLEQEVARGNMLVGDMVLLEVLRGARNDQHSAFLEAQLRQFAVVAMLDDQLASTAANYRKLRALGITPRSFADLIIANFCIEHGHQLLHDDRDFAPMVEHLGLRLA